MLRELTLLAVLGAASPDTPEPPKPQAAPADTPAPETTADQAEAAPAEPVPAWPLPWNQGVTYRYTWYTNEPIGQSSFSLNWSEDRKTLLCKGAIDLRGVNPRLDGAFVSGFRPDLHPTFHAGTFRGAQAGAQGVGAGVVAKFGEKEVVVTFGFGPKAPEMKLAPPAQPYFLYGHQAIHHWALFLTAVDTAKPSVVKVCMPDFLRFCDIAFTPEGAEELRGVTATRLAFDAGGLFRGKVWLDPRKRLLRFQHKNETGFTDIWLIESE